MEQHELRWLLFDEFRKIRSYQNALAQLRPLWRAAKSDAEPFADSRAFPGLHVMARHRSSDDRHVLRTYVEAVERVVASILHVTWDGRAPTWACNFVHSDVNPDSTAAGYEHRDPVDGPIPPGERFGPVFRHVDLFVNPSVARVGYGEDLGNWPVTVPAAQLMQFAEWDTLKREAGAYLDQVIDGMRAEYEQKYPDKRRPSTRKHQLAQLHGLAVNLLDVRDGRPVIASNKKIAEIAKVIGVTYPRPASPRKSG